MPSNSTSTCPWIGIWVSNNWWACWNLLKILKVLSGSRSPIYFVEISMLKWWNLQNSMENQNFNVAISNNDEKYLMDTLYVQLYTLKLVASEIKVSIPR